MTYEAQELHRGQENQERPVGDLKPAMFLRSATQMLHRRQENQERPVGDSKPAMSLRSAAQMLHRGQENQERPVGDSKPVMSLRSATQMPHRGQENQKRPVGDSKPAMSLRSAAQMLHKTEESPEHLISDVKPTVALSSSVKMQYGGHDRTPLAMRRSPKIDVEDFLAEADYPAMDYSTNRRTSGQSTMDDGRPLAPLVYAVPINPPVERESKKEVVVKKEEPKEQPINISKLSDRIYSMIESRLKIDRERRGVCG